MGGALRVRQGLAINVLTIESARFHSTKKMRRAKKSKRKQKADPAYSLIRTTEVQVIGAVPPDQVAEMIRDKGLKIGIRLRAHHQRVSVQYAFGAALPAPADFREVDEAPTVTSACEAVFGNREQWFGFKIPKEDIPPLSYPADAERLYVILAIDNFQPHHRMAFDEVPVVAVLASFPGFREHYALGMGIFTLGKLKQSIQFDTTVLGSM